MKKIHMLETIMVSFAFILLLYFSLPHFLQTQLSKKISLLQQETQDVINRIEFEKVKQNKREINIEDLPLLFKQYKRTNFYGIHGGRGGLTNNMFGFTKLKYNETEVNTIFVMTLANNINPRRSGFKDYATISLSNPPHDPYLTMTTIKQLDKEMRDYFIEEQSKGRTDLNPNIEYLQSKSYNVSNGLTSEGFLMSYQYTKVPYQNKP